MSGSESERVILEAIAHYASELGQLDIDVDESFFTELRQALHRQSRACGLDASVTFKIDQAVESVRRQWLNPSPEQGDYYPAAVAG